jgi:Gpi18-like mannosyltransferase
MSTFSLRRQAAYTILLFSLLLLLQPHAGHDSDMSFWVSWAKDIFYQGLGNVYQSPTNSYNPLYHYILWLFGKMMGSGEKIVYYRHWLKAFTLVFDFGGAFWAASLVRERDRRFGLALLLLLNIGYLYSTLVWIQVDAIYTFFAFGAVVLAVQRRAVGSMLCFVLAMAAKPQGVIFLPPLLLLWVPQWWHRPRILVQAVVAGAVLLTLILAPFIWGGEQSYLPRILEINLGAANFFAVLSMNAYNLWHIIAPDPDPMVTYDTLPLAGLTYRVWGLLLFFVSSALALLPMLLLALRHLRRPESAGPESISYRDDLALVLLSCGLIPLLFTFFNTQMHERYWHAAVLFLAAYGFLRRDYLLYVLVSVAYFLNLEGVLRHLQLRKYSVLLFQPWFVASLFALTIVLGLWKLYRLTAWRDSWRIIRGGALAA